MSQKRVAKKSPSKKGPGRPAKIVSSKTKTLNDGDAKEQLIQVATRLFGEKGFDSVSTREIADEAGLNIGLISYYFGGKLGLYRGVIRSHISKFTEAIKPSATPKAPLTKALFRNALKTIIDNCFGMAEEQRHIMNIMEREKIEGMPHTKEIHEEIITPIAHQLVLLLQAGQKKGFIRKDVNPQTFFILFFESIQGYLGIESCELSFKEKALKPGRDSEALKDFILNLFLRGIEQ